MELRPRPRAPLLRLPQREHLPAVLECIGSEPRGLALFLRSTWLNGVPSAAPGSLNWRVRSVSALDWGCAPSPTSWKASGMDSEQLWQEVRHQRWQLADQVEDLDEVTWDSASWCEGWRVRDVLGHLVHLAEASQLSMGVDMVRGGLRPDRALRRAAQRFGDEPVPSLCQRLRAAGDGRFHVLGSPSAVTLGEVLVHSSDALRPLGRELDAPPVDATTVLDVYWKLGRLAFHAAPHRGHRLTATDCDWTKGKGPDIAGRAIDLLLFIANRRQVLPHLEGVDSL